MTQSLLKIAAVVLSIVVLQSCDNKGGASSDMISGYKYVVHDKGSGAAIAPGDYVTFTLQIVDDKGTVLQSNTTDPLPAVQIPAPDSPPQAPNPIVDLIGMSTVGDSIELIMPRDSLKGPMPEGNEDLQSISYVMRLTKAEDEASYQTAVEEQRKVDAAKGELIMAREVEVKALVETIGKTIDDGSAKIETTDSGLQYIIHQEGSGPNAKSGDVVDVFYYGTLENGDEFDNAFKRGKEFQFTVGQGMVIKGWDEGLPLLKEGGSATLIVPADLGYGEQATGTIPANSTLRFYVELVDIK